MKRLLTEQESAARWDAFTLEHTRNLVAFLSNRWQYEVPLFTRILKSVPAGGSVLEVGCGAGASVLWLAARGLRAYGVDYRPAVIGVAQGLATRLGSSASFAVADAFALHGEYDLVFSTGVLEHWEADRLVEALREQARVAQYVCAAVPTRNTRYTGEITDEHFYGRRLLTLFRAAGLREVEMFAYGDAPNVANRALKKALPPLLFDTLQNRSLTLAMTQAVIARSR